MGGGILLEDPLSFEAKYPIDLADPVWKRISLTTLNWVFTNLNGMIFGVFFGAAFLCLLRYLPKRGFNNGFANSALGLAIGAPLGVCVNCAAPIAKGIYSGGARLETSLSTMIASPTINVIVLTMLFSLFPFYMAVMKIGLSLFVILIAVPVICRFVPNNETQIESPNMVVNSANLADFGNDSENFIGTLIGFFKDYSHDLWFIIRLTVPMMFMAGFLGAFVATILPLDLIQNFPFSLAAVIAIVAIGLFLPVPIAFDIILAAALLASGAPVGFVMALLFTLGIFSVYSYIIVASTMSFRAATGTTIVIAILGIASAYMAQSYQQWDFKKGLELIPGKLSLGLVGTANAATAELYPVKIEKSETGKISVFATPFVKRSPAGDTPFTRSEAWHLGVDRPNLFGIKDMVIPFQQAQGSIAAADLDNDGDPDVILSDSNGGIRIYLNDGTGQFRQPRLDLPKIKGFSVLHAAPADINNDGWIDLVLTTFANGEFLLLNEKGNFSENRLIKLKNQPRSRHVMALAFGDLDKNGLLEIVLGNHSALPGFFEKGEYDRNRIIFNKGSDKAGVKHYDTSGAPGETLTLLLSDINQDGNLDLIEGNDFSEPDLFSFGDGTGKLKQITANSKIIPHSTLTTMSAKSADLNNDLKLEIYLSQIAGRSKGLFGRVDLRSYEDYCLGIERYRDIISCKDNLKIKEWHRPLVYRFSQELVSKCKAMNKEYIWDCYSLLLRNLAFLSKKPELCDRIPVEKKRFRLLCNYYIEAKKHIGKRGEATPEDGTISMYMTGEDLVNDIPQIFGANVLLVNRGDGKFEDRAKAANLEIGAWSWDVKIFDFDNDGDQDIHILNGDWMLNEFAPSNILMRNDGELKFTNQTKEFGLIDYLVITGSAAADFDNDGDIDQIAQSINGPVISYKNNSQSGNTIAFEYRDFIGNHFGIGNKIVIHYGENGAKKQLRELKLGGGYMSYDAPVVHFGLGEYDVVQKIEIEWSTGETSNIKGPFKTNASYRIERR